MDRKIFKYHDGEAEVFADPSELDYQISRLDIETIMFPDRLADVPTLPDGTVDCDRMDPLDIKLLIDSSHDADPLIRQAFGIKPFDRTTGKGLMFDEVVKLFDRYLSWRNEVKKNTPVIPISALPTA